MNSYVKIIGAAAILATAAICDATPEKKQLTKVETLRQERRWGMTTLVGMNVANYWGFRKLGTGAVRVRLSPGCWSHCAVASICAIPTLALTTVGYLAYKGYQIHQAQKELKRA